MILDMEKCLVAIWHKSQNEEIRHSKCFFDCCLIESVQNLALYLRATDYLHTALEFLPAFCEFFFITSDISLGLIL